MVECLQRNRNRASGSSVVQTENEPTKAQRSRYSDWLRAGRRRGRVRLSVRSRIFSSPPRPDRLWCPRNLSNGYRGALSAALKQPGRDAYHSPPASAEVKKMWVYTSIPPYAFMVGWFVHSCCSHLEHTASMERFVSLQFLNIVDSR
jgi:hypothetical protein